MHWIKACCWMTAIAFLTLIAVPTLPQVPKAQEDLTDSPTVINLETLVSRSRRETMRSYKRHPQYRFQFTKVEVGLNQQTRFLTKFGPYIIKLHLYLDKKLENRFVPKESALKAAKEVVNFANTLLRPFNAYIMVTSLHQPSKHHGYSPDLPDTDILKFLRSEYAYNYYQYMFDDVIDCIFAFLGREHNNNPMSDSAGRLCHDIYGRPDCLGFVALDTNQPHYIKTAGFALAHELSHRLGGSHDSGGCRCHFPRCLMSEYVGKDDGNALIGGSTCSILSVADYLDSLALDKACLSVKLITPVYTDRRSIITQYSKTWGPTCGNGVLEPGEECDCGGALACQNNRCCQGDTCKLARGTVCGTGDCCSFATCTPLAQGVICRLAADPRCDFPEVCDGQSSNCPPDLTVMPDWPCDLATGHRCRLRHCLPPRNGAKYTGPQCQPGKSVPTVTGRCTPMHQPGPAEEIEAWVEPLPKEAALDFAVAPEKSVAMQANKTDVKLAASSSQASQYYQPMFELEGLAAQILRVPGWLVAICAVSFLLVA